jgi:glycosyltransferase involved in cell wall biosynthesis
MEAFAAGKPVLTTTDAGGVLDIVRHGETGLVAEPNPEALGAALARLAADRAAARRMGAAGRDMLARLGLNWGTTLEKLLG